MLLLYPPPHHRTNSHLILAAYQPCPCGAFGLWSMVAVAVGLFVVMVVAVDRCVFVFHSCSLVAT